MASTKELRGDRGIVSLLRDGEIGCCHECLCEQAASEIEKLLTVLKPFAEYADPRNKFPESLKITNGSGFARQQLTMGDCYRARDAINIHERGGSDG